MPRKKGANGKEIRRSRVGQKSGAQKRALQATSGTGKKYAYVFVLNNYTDEDVDALSDAVNSMPEVIYLDFGFEIGESGTPHLQGQIELNIEGIKSSPGGMP